MPVGKVERQVSQASKRECSLCSLISVSHYREYYGVQRRLTLMAVGCMEYRVE